MKICLFDLNGTILDDTLIWYESVCKTFGSQRKQVPTIPKYFQELEQYGGDYLEIYRSRGIALTREELDAIYYKFYEDLVSKVNLKPHVIETLTVLLNKGVILGLITAQLQELVDPILVKFKLNKLFSYIKFHIFDKKKAIVEIIRQENVSPEDCYYVGDSPSDVRHANKTGIVSVAFLDSYIPEELIAAAQPKITIRDFKELTFYA